jgi:hypothetical protein
MVGDHLGETLGKGAKVIIIEGNPRADNAKQRKEGFMRSVQKFGLKLLDSKTAHWETEEANTLMTNLLTKYPKALPLSIFPIGFRRFSRLATVSDRHFPGGIDHGGSQQRSFTDWIGRFCAPDGNRLYYRRRCGD